jgi:hypothetical protein
MREAAPESTTRASTSTRRTGTARQAVLHLGVPGLLDRCVAEAAKGVPAETRASLESIFNLLRQIDESRDAVVFFAYEDGSWQVGVDWAKVFSGLVPVPLTGSAP